LQPVGPDATAEARLLDAGTAADVRGGRIPTLPGREREAVIGAFPRLGFKELFIGLLEDQAARKPQCVVAAYLAGGAASEIRAAPFAD
jgi:hypothetical protein